MPQTAKKRPKRKPAARCKVSRRRKPPAQRASQYAFDPEYCSLLEDWLNVEAGPIIPGADSLPRYELVKP